jgi:hypothetical protein
MHGHQWPKNDGESFFPDLICTFWGYFKESTNELFNVDIQNLIITNQKVNLITLYFSTTYFRNFDHLDDIF